MTFCHFQFMQTLRTRAAKQRANKWIGVYSLAAIGSDVAHTPTPALLQDAEGKMYKIKELL